MPSSEHEAPIALARHDPGLATQLLTEVFGVELPEHVRARLHADDIQLTVPATYHADSVLVYENADGRPVLAIVLEVQRAWDRRKRRTWRLYLTHVEAELDVSAALLVYCPVARVGERYRRYFETDGISNILHPFVLTPDQVPLITDPVAAERSPALAVLSALAHSRDAALDTAFPALAAALQAAGPDHALRYHDIVLTGLAGSARTRWEDFMTATPYKSQWLSAEFRAAEAKGIAQGKAQDVLLVLTTRGIEVPEEIRDRIETTTDLAVLDDWLRRSITADGLSEVIDD
ncbi:hypothetical protein [Nocardioides sp. BYT-33-1]|uniref:hypothetical protein n=1 Tax=Nocardioides sp. BYT-33-1 TaxID=3416952 RepID=UPI003F5301FE